MANHPESTTQCYLKLAVGQLGSTNSQCKCACDIPSALVTLALYSVGGAVPLAGGATTRANQPRSVNCEEITESVRWRPVCQIRLLESSTHIPHGAFSIQLPPPSSLLVSAIGPCGAGADGHGGEVQGEEETSWVGSFTEWRLEMAQSRRGCSTIAEVVPPFASAHCASSAAATNAAAAAAAPSWTRGCRQPVSADDTLSPVANHRCNAGWVFCIIPTSSRRVRRSSSVWNSRCRCSSSARHFSFKRYSSASNCARAHRAQ